MSEFTCGEGLDLIVLDTLRTPLSGVYLTKDCDDMPEPSFAAMLINNIRESTQTVMLTNSNVYYRKVSFVDNEYSNWIPSDLNHKQEK